MKFPDVWDEVDLLRQAGRHGLQLAWQALLKMATNFLHSGEQGYGERDGPGRFEDDKFHWEVDSFMLQCCIQLEAEAPEHLHPSHKLRDLNQMRNEITGSYPDLAYRYYFTNSYLKWVRGGKIGDYEKPMDYDELTQVPSRPAPNPAPQMAGVRTKQTARKQAPSYMRSSKYRLTFTGREDLLEDESDEESDETGSSDNDGLDDEEGQEEEEEEE